MVATTREMASWTSRVCATESPTDDSWSSDQLAPASESISRAATTGAGHQRDFVRAFVRLGRSVAVACWGLLTSHASHEVLPTT